MESDPAILRATSQGSRLRPVRRMEVTLSSHPLARTLRTYRWDGGHCSLFQEHLHSPLTMPQPPFSWKRPGHWLYQLWYRPLAAVQRSRREGGPLEQWKNHRGRQAMRTAAIRLPAMPVRSPQQGEPCLIFLTGHAYWEQSAFCLRSLQAQVPGRTWPVLFIDDGTLSPAQWRSLDSAFPGSNVVSGSSLQRALDALLPVNRFPTLREHRRYFPLLRKLTDTHAARPGPNLVLDADMLFHRPPDELLAWMDDPSLPMVMTDCQESYGYARSVLATLAPGPIPESINTGICGFETSTIDWNDLERWTRFLLGTQGSSYFLEQSLVALLLSGRSHRQLSRDNYQVAPAPAEILNLRAVLHHYVALTKRGYFRHAWRRYASSDDRMPRSDS